MTDIVSSMSIIGLTIVPVSGVTSENALKVGTATGSAVSREYSAMESTSVMFDGIFSLFKVQAVQG